jgi:hypothetical protein
MKKEDSLYDYLFDLLNGGKSIEEIRHSADDGEGDEGCNHHAELKH